MKPEERASPGPRGQAGTGPSQRVDGLAAENVRREHDRFSVELEVDVLNEHNLYAGLAENISAGGLFIATHKLQQVGSKIELALRMPGSEAEYQIVGEVRWVRLYNEASDTSPGLGVRFLELPPGAAAAIERFVAQREPLFFDDE